MATSVVELRNIAGTEAALGWAGCHTVVVDRPEGKARGKGLGFNGAQLLGLALGGCYCNDLRYAAHEMGREIGEIAVTVSIELEGTPLVSTRADLSVDCRMRDGSDGRDVIARAWDVCTIANSLRQGLTVRNASLDASRPELPRGGAR